MVQAALPQEYAQSSPLDLDARIAAAKAKLGKRLVILGHHYQRDEIIKHADFRGDSYKLAKDAAAHPEAEFIVFCGVHFMAESADILTPDTQKVILPNMAAGCSMADMANLFQVRNCWKALEGVYGAIQPPRPDESNASALGETAQKLHELGFATERQLLQAKAQELGIGFANLEGITIESDALTAVPADLLYLHRAFPVKRQDETLYLAMVNPNNLQGIDQIQQASRCRVIPVMASLTDIEGAISKHFPDAPATSLLERPRVQISPRIAPVTYINSAANLKGFVGEHGGTVCTSTNAPTAVKWALDHADKVLFFPDQHLGRNTGVKLGFDPDRDMCVWDPFQPLGGNTEEKLREATFILWKGHCSVHKRFTVEQIEKARDEHPGCSVIVHPECELDVVRAADLNGSTELIIREVTAAPAGTTWAVGTEINLVNRLAKEMPEKTIFCLDPQICPCSTMYRIHPSFLCWILEGLVRGEVMNQVIVPERTREFAKIALDRMLTLP